MTVAKSFFGWSDKPSVSREFSSHGPWTLENKGLKVDVLHGCLKRQSEE